MKIAAAGRAESLAVEATASSRTGHLRPWAGGVARIVDEDRWIFALVALHAALGLAVLTATGTTTALAYGAYFPLWPLIFLVLFPFIYGMLGVLQVVHRVERRRILAFRRVMLGDRLVHLAAGFILLAAMMIFQGTFTSLKNAMPLWHDGFSYDRTQADIDAALHFGRDPWRYLMAIAGTDTVRAIVEWNYNQGWFIVCFAAMFWVAVSKEARAVRTRYFLCYVMAWIAVGNLLAGLFLSAGPAFYGPVTGDFARFADQLAFLAHGADGAHSAIRYQQYLWHLYERQQAGIGSGIAAFPSMHVSLVTLNALFLFERHRSFGLAAFAYVAFVLASSVFLAWHYAIDGYVAIAATVAIYLLTRRLMRQASASAAG